MIDVQCNSGGFVLTSGIHVGTDADIVKKNCDVHSTLFFFRLCSYSI